MTVFSLITAVLVNELRGKANKGGVQLLILFFSRCLSIVVVFGRFTHDGWS